MDSSSVNGYSGAIAFQLQYMTKIGQMVTDQTEAQGAQVMQMLESTAATAPTASVDPTSSVGQNIDTYA